jgi:formylmethanofuran dehydrogenase subunit E
MDFDTALKEAVNFHGNLCVGLVLGTRIAIAGLENLGINSPSEARDLIVFVEIDRCLADAIQAITRCTFGKRKLKYVDYGKFAATFVNTRTKKALRISIKEKARESALKYGQEHGLVEQGRILSRKQEMETMATAYSQLSDDDLLNVEAVYATVPACDLPGLPRYKTVCAICGETIFDHREKMRNHRTLCRACAEGTYYTKNRHDKSGEVFLARKDRR